MDGHTVSEGVSDRSFGILVGKTLSRIVVSKDNDQMSFFTVDGGEYALWHSQDCCESVSIDDIVGDLGDLLGSPIVRAEERSETGSPKESYDESHTWTFYEIATNKGSVTIRWYGTSNGYYSESVDFARIKKGGDSWNQPDSLA